MKNGNGICVIGGDRRQYYLAKELAHNGYSVTAYAVPGIAPTDDLLPKNRPFYNGDNDINCDDENVFSTRNDYDAVSKREEMLNLHVSDSNTPKNATTKDAPVSNDDLFTHRRQFLRSRSDKTQNGAQALSATTSVGSVTAYGDIRSALSGCVSVILPFPLSPDGITLNCSEEEKPSLRDVFLAISETCGGAARIFGGAVKERSREIAASLGIEVTDYGAMEEIALENAVPTAEGALETAMKHLEVTVRGSRFAVIGYGRCGSELARLLTAMGAQVSAVARSVKDRAKMRNDGVIALGFDSIVSAVNNAEITFNTVPFNILDCSTLSRLKEGRIIIELASAPGGVDRECAAEYGVKVIHAPSLPGKYAPKTAAEIIVRALTPML